MYLAHLVNKYPEQYSGKAVQNNFKIMDNSLCENDLKSLSLEELLHAAEFIKADEIVLPDSIDPEESLYLTAAASCKVGNKYRQMAVVHGETMEDCVSFFRFLTKLADVTTIGLPRPIAHLAPGQTGRIQLAHFIRENYSKYNIHFLGSEFGMHELVGRRVSHIRSMDTAWFLKQSAMELSIMERRPKGLVVDLEEERYKLHSIVTAIADQKEFLKEWCW
jgi:hypothetical protein